jgi:hypothetical protein
MSTHFSRPPGPPVPQKMDATTKEVLSRFMPKGALKDRMEAFGGLPQGPDVSVDYLIGCTDAVMVGLLADMQRCQEADEPVSMAHVQMYATLSKVALQCRQYEVDRRVQAKNMLGRVQGEAFVTGLTTLVKEVMPDEPVKRERFEAGVRALFAECFPSEPG